MHKHTRRAVAGICGAILLNRKISSVYDHSDDSIIAVDAEVRGGTIKAYDYDKGCFIEGDLPSGVYHFGDSHFLEIKQTNGKIDGYDFGTSTFFEAKLSESLVELYDFGDSSFYFYSVT